MPVRVLHIISSLGIGGAERLVLSAARGLPAATFDQAVCCLAERGVRAADAEAAGVPVYTAGRFPGFRHPLAFARLVRIVRGVRPTIVHTHLQSANLYGRVAARLAGAPIVVATDHNVYADKPRRYIAVERLLARTTDALVAVSGEVQQNLARQLNLAPSAIRIIRNGVAAEAPSAPRAAELRARMRVGAGGVRLGTVASLTSKKGHDVLLRAVARLQADGVDCALALAGDGAERPRIEALIDRLALGDRVQLLGAIANVADLLAAIDLFVLPSLVEGMPLALLEAMRAGTPVIATAVGGVPEVVRPGVNGLLAPPADDAALADAIASLARSPSERDRLGAAARDTIERAGFTEEAYLASLSALYLELVDRRRLMAAS
jgi:glycosyltransferase involved in cell wall biosynthesis